MIVGEESPLRRIPAQVNRKQTLFFDGIRYSIEMADLAHARLRQTLLRGTGDDSTLPPVPVEPVPAILDAWSIIDSVHRLRGLLRQCPGLKQNSPGLRVFWSHTVDVEAMRNLFQHLNTQIDHLVANNVPVLGVLSWLVMPSDGTGTVRTCLLIPGTMFKSKGHPLVNPAGKTIRPPIDHITLTAGGHSACLSGIMRQVAQLAGSCERELAERFAGLSLAGADVVVALGFSLTPPAASDLARCTG